MDLKGYDLSQWEKDILNEFDEDDCLVYLCSWVKEDDTNDFLICLADDLKTFKDKQQKG